MPVLVFRLICCQLYLPALQSAASLIPFCFCRYLARILNPVLCHPWDLSAEANFSFPSFKVYWSVTGKAYWQCGCLTRVVVFFPQPTLIWRSILPFGIMCLLSIFVTAKKLPGVGNSRMYCQAFLSPKLPVVLPFLLQLKIPKPWLRKPH